MPGRRQLRCWIVIRNGDDMRLTRRQPNLLANEVAVEVIINTPTPPRIIGSVLIDLPDPPPAIATGGAIEYGKEDDGEPA